MWRKRAPRSVTVVETADGAFAEIETRPGAVLLAAGGALCPS
jgi:hypothetical protein